MSDSVLIQIDNLGVPRGGNSPWGITFGDIDGDGDIDVGVANWGSGLNIQLMVLIGIGLV